MVNKRRKTIFFYFGTSQSVSFKNLLNVCEISSISTLSPALDAQQACQAETKNPDSLGSSQNIRTSPHTSITNLRKLIGLQVLSKLLSPLPLSLSLDFCLFLSSSPSLRVSWNAGRRARRACLCVGGLSASFLFKQEPTQRPHFPAKFKPEAMLTVWCYRPLSDHISVGKVVRTWVGNSTPRHRLHHFELPATHRLVVFIYAWIQFGTKW